MASLRARLLVALLALTALGLLLLGGITYVEQRSFELDRVDDQVRDGAPAVVVAVRDQGIGKAPSLDPRAADRRPASRPAAVCRSGTYGELRNADGTVVGVARLRLRPGHHGRSEAPARHPARPGLHGAAARTGTTRPLPRLRRIATCAAAAASRRRSAAGRDRPAAEPAARRRVARDRRGPAHARR